MNSFQQLRLSDRNVRLLGRTGKRRAVRVGRQCGGLGVVDAGVAGSRVRAVRRIGARANDEGVERAGLAATGVAGC